MNTLLTRHYAWSWLTAGSVGQMWGSGHADFGGYLSRSTSHPEEGVGQTALEDLATEPISENARNQGT